MVLLAYWFARKNLRRHSCIYNVYITDMIQVRSITDMIIPFQTGSVFSQRAKQTGAQYKHRVLFTEDDNHRVIFTLDDCITVSLWVANNNMDL